MLIFLIGIASCNEPQDFEIIRANGDTIVADENGYVSEWKGMVMFDDTVTNINDYIDR